MIKFWFYLAGNKMNFVRLVDTSYEQDELYKTAVGKAEV